MLSRIADPQGASMDADPELLLTTVFVTADDLLPESRQNAARSVTDAEVVTLVWPRRSWASRLTVGFFWSRASVLGTCSRSCPSGWDTSNAAVDWPTRSRWLMGVFASQSPGFDDDLLLIDSTPVECARSVRRSSDRRWQKPPTTAGAARTRATSGGFRLHEIFSPDGDTARAAADFS